MTRTILLTSANESFGDGFHRRRVMIPAAGLQCMGWRPRGRADAPRALAVAEAMVLDGMDPEDEVLAAAAAAARVSLVLDANRWARSGAEAAPEGLLRIAARASAVAVPPGPLGLAAGEALKSANRLVVVPDPVETPAALQLAAMYAGVAFSPRDIDRPVADMAVWFIEPEDSGVHEELAALKALAPALRAARQPLLALVPAALLEETRRMLGRSVQVAEWSPQTVASALSRARAFIVPGAPGTGGWSVARRANLALALGAPVLAPSGPDMSELNPAMVLDDWEGGLARAVSGELALAVAGGPSGVAAADAALHWNNLLEDLAAGEVRRRERGRPVRLLIFMDLIQDGELCLPVIREAKARPDVEPHVAVTSWFALNAPGAMAAMKELGVEPEIVEREEAAHGERPKVENYDACLVVVATNLPGHRNVQGVVKRARTAGVPSFSMQHGLENVGLTFFDEVHTDKVKITSDYLFVWFPPDYEPPSPPSLRRKFIHVGAVKPTSFDGPPAPLPVHAGSVISVFENLHWHRYDHEYRQQFLADLAQAARSAPDDLFVLKPHSAGMWTRGQVLDELPANVTVIDPIDPAWLTVTAQALIALSDRVITTPSTIALDAALARRPVAVVGYRLDLLFYEPLPVLRRSEDWSTFAGPQGRLIASDAVLDAFLRRRLIRGDAESRLLTALIDRSRAVS